MIISYVERTVSNAFFQIIEDPKFIQQSVRSIHLLFVGLIIDISQADQPDHRYHNGCYLAISHYKYLFIYNSVMNTILMCTHVRLIILTHVQQYDIHGLTIHPQKDLVLTSDNKGRIDQWYVLSQNPTSQEVLNAITRGNEQNVTVDLLEELKLSPLKTVELTHPVGQ